ncbi:MAG: YeeE/YedE family protein [Candidatus Eisenbacteria bacterium]|nr:YeeE/YedE family protein [Candidatus Eisenbacteria bacterium]
MAPFALAPLAGTFAYFVIFLLLGMGFGAVLEMSGFGDSRRLSAQFYLRDMTVLKVMFTGIIVAAVLVHLASALQLLDLSKVWINPTYMVPGIVGGLIMGVGFIVGGFCPGTSLVAASTLKLDGVMFVLGGFVGALAFGETVHSFSAWWHSTSWGRFTLYDWLHVPAGWVVLGLVVMALGVFVFAEQVERNFGAGRPDTADSPEAKAGLSFGVPSLNRRAAQVFAVSLVALAAVTAFVGQPDLGDRWRWIAPKAGPLLAQRDIFVDPAEVVELQRDLSLTVRVLEVRGEPEYNLFHLAGSRRISLDECGEAALVRELSSVPDNTILLLASNGEEGATEAWKRLKAQGVLNLYVIDGGINHWLEVFPPRPELAARTAPAGENASDDFGWRFSVATSAQTPSAQPDAFEPGHHAGGEGEAPGWFDGSRLPAYAFTKKVKLQKKVVAKGGCG